MDTVMAKAISQFIILLFTVAIIPSSMASMMAQQPPPLQAVPVQQSGLPPSQISGLYPPPGGNSNAANVMVYGSDGRPINFKLPLPQQTTAMSGVCQIMQVVQSSQSPGQGIDGSDSIVNHPQMRYYGWLPTGPGGQLQKVELRGPEFAIDPQWLWYGGQQQMPGGDEYLLVVFNQTEVALVMYTWDANGQLHYYMVQQPPWTTSFQSQTLQPEVIYKTVQPEVIYQTVPAQIEYVSQTPRVIYEPSPPPIIVTQPASPPPPVQTSAKPAGDCASGEWKYFQGHCYQIVVDVTTGGINNAVAAEKCAALGAKLASVHSEEENKFLFQLGFSSPVPLRVPGRIQGLPFDTAEGAYIGMKRKINTDRSGVCEWMDGSPVDFGREMCEHPPPLPGPHHRPWGDMQPDNAFQFTHGPEECVFMVHAGGPSLADNQWGDIPCSIKFAGGYCKKPCSGPC